MILIHLMRAGKNRNQYMRKRILVLSLALLASCERGTDVNNIIVPGERIGGYEIGARAEGFKEDDFAVATNGGLIELIWTSNSDFLYDGKKLVGEDVNVFLRSNPEFKRNFEAEEKMHEMTYELESGLLLHAKEDIITSVTVVK